jgi:hypothetical protein
MDRLDHPPVPFLFASFIDYFIKHIVQIIERVHDLANIGRLQFIHLGVAQRVNPSA